jgi:hypothetical protein
MLIDLYHADYEHKEYERRVRSLLLERALLKARADRANALARLAAGLATTIWRWGWRTLNRGRWTLPALGKPYGETQP